jgi:cation transport ATPase
VDTVFLDKTGTLTYGIPLVTKVSHVPGISEQTLLESRRQWSGASGYLTQAEHWVNSL